MLNLLKNISHPWILALVLSISMGLAVQVRSASGNPVAAAVLVEADKLLNTANYFLRLGRLCGRRRTLRGLQRLFWPSPVPLLSANLRFVRSVKNAASIVRTLFRRLLPMPA